MFNDNFVSCNNYELIINIQFKLLNYEPYSFRETDLIKRKFNKASASPSWKTDPDVQFRIDNRKYKLSSSILKKNTNMKVTKLNGCY